VYVADMQPCRDACRPEERRLQKALGSALPGPSSYRLGCRNVLIERKEDLVSDVAEDPQRRFSWTPALSGERGGGRANLRVIGVAVLRRSKILIHSGWSYPVHGGSPFRLADAGGSQHRFPLFDLRVDARTELFELVWSGPKVLEAMLRGRSTNLRSQTPALCVIGTPRVPWGDAVLRECRAGDADEGAGSARAFRVAAPVAAPSVDHPNEPASLLPAAHPRDHAEAGAMPLARLLFSLKEA
jgi:hypothetical protein